MTPTITERANAVLQQIKERMEGATKLPWRIHAEDPRDIVDADSDTLIVRPYAAPGPSDPERNGRANARAIVLQMNGWPAQEALVQGMIERLYEITVTDKRKLEAVLLLWVESWEERLGK